MVVYFLDSGRGLAGKVEPSHVVDCGQFDACGVDIGDATVYKEIHGYFTFREQRVEHDQRFIKFHLNEVRGIFENRDGFVLAYSDVRVVVESDEDDDLDGESDEDEDLDVEEGEAMPKRCVEYKWVTGPIVSLRYIAQTNKLMAQALFQYLAQPASKRTLFTCANESAAKAFLAKYVEVPVRHAPPPESTDVDIQEGWRLRVCHTATEHMALGPTGFVNVLTAAPFAPYGIYMVYKGSSFENRTPADDDREVVKACERAKNFTKNQFSSHVA